MAVVSLPTMRVLRWFAATLVVVALTGRADCRKAFQRSDADRQLGEIDIARIRELHHITDLLGEQILHECFHCYQLDYRQRAEEAGGELPEDDPVYAALIGLESRLLKASLETSDEQEVRRLAGMFVAVRTERRKDLAPHLVLREGEDEYNEGTATYSAARMYQLLAEKGGMPPGESLQDPQYQHFSRANEEYQRLMAAIIPPTDQPVTFFHAMYQHGMAQCFVLDRLRPAWKEEMRTKGMTQCLLLEKELSLDETARASLLAEARSRFNYEELLARQKELVGARLNLIRGYVAAPGRRYRIYHGDIHGKFNWKPAGPVYQVPESLERELAAKDPQAKEDVPRTGTRRLVWVGGVRRFEKDTLVFESVETPIIFGQAFLEWIDTTPASDATDMEIKSEAQDGEIHYGVHVRTDGFTLKMDKARIEWSADVVNIHPLPRP